MRNGGKKGRTKRRERRQVLLTLREVLRRQPRIRLWVPLIPLVPRFHGRKVALCGRHLPVPSFLPSRSQHRWICLTPSRRISMVFPAVRGVLHLREYARLSHRHSALGCHRSVNIALLSNRCVHRFRHRSQRLQHLFGHGNVAVVTIYATGTRARHRVRVRVPHHL